MSFLLVEISSETIQLWGYPKNGTPELLSVNGETSLPPFLYSQEGELKVNKFAQERFRKNDPNAYGNFALNVDKTQKFKGDTRTLADIFVFALSNILSESDQSELLNIYNDKSLPIRFWLSPEIRKNAKVFIDAFKKADFQNVCEFTQNKGLQDLFSVNENVIILTGIEGNLYVDFVDQNSVFKGDTSMVTGAGADPRVQVLADLIFKDIHSSDPYVKEENEKALIIEEARKALEKDSAFYRGNLYSSEGQNYGFKVKKSDVEKELKYKSDSAKIFGELDLMSAKQDFSISSNTPVFILGDAICTDNFSVQISDRYSKIHLITGRLKKDLLRQAFEVEKKNGFKPTTISDGEKGNPEVLKLIEEGDSFLSQNNLKLALYRYEEAFGLDPSYVGLKQKIEGIKKSLDGGGGSGVGNRSCPKCKKLIPTNDFAAHVRSCKGDAPEPPKRPCPKCKKQFPARDFAAHVSSCKGGAPEPPKRPCPKCKKLIAGNQFAEHLKTCSTTNQPVRPKPPKPPVPKPPKPEAKKPPVPPRPAPPKPHVPKGKKPPVPPRPTPPKPPAPKGKGGPPDLPKPPPLKK